MRLRAVLLPISLGMLAPNVALGVSDERQGDEPPTRAFPLIDDRPEREPPPTPIAEPPRQLPPAPIHEPPIPPVQPERDPWDSPWSFDVVLGLGAPTGEIGGALDLAPAPWLSIWIGGGFGAQGPQIAGGARLRPIWTDAKDAIGVELGVSTGPYKSKSCAGSPFMPSDGGCEASHWENAVWANFSLGYGDVVPEVSVRASQSVTPAASTQKPASSQPPRVKSKTSTFSPWPSTSHSESRVPWLRSPQSGAFLSSRSSHPSQPSCRSSPRTSALITSIGVTMPTSFPRASRTTSRWLPVSTMRLAAYIA